MKPVAQKKTICFSIMVFTLSFIFIGLTACSGGKSQSQENSPVAAEQTADHASKAKEASSGNTTSKTPEGWQKARHEEWSVSFPEDWNSDPDTGIWQPGEVGPFMGRPAVSVHMGGIPVMPPADFEERVKSHISGDPQERDKISIAGFPGIKCSWEHMGKKHRGIFLEEKVGAGMIMIHFSDCQAPAAEFDQYKADFEKILDSIGK